MHSNVFVFNRLKFSSIDRMWMRQGNNCRNPQAQQESTDENLQVRQGHLGFNLVQIKVYLTLFLLVLYVLHGLRFERRKKFKNLDSIRGFTPWTIEASHISTESALRAFDPTILLGRSVEYKRKNRGWLSWFFMSPNWTHSLERHSVCASYSRPYCVPAWTEHEYFPAQTEQDLLSYLTE